MKDQFVIACIENAANAAVVLPWARHMAERLNHKGLMALHVSPEKGDDGWLKELGVPYVSMQGDWATAIEGLPIAFNGILTVAASDPKAPRTSLTHPKTLLHEFRNCKTAYLVVNGNCAPRAPFTASLTLTHRREGKEKLVWASYLARFVGGQVVIASPHYRDEDLRMRWHNNMRFVNKVFGPLEIQYSTFTIHPSTLTSPDLAAINELKPDLLIARTTDIREKDLIDLLLPHPEVQLLTHPLHPLILFLNPRDDLYILCD